MIKRETITIKAKPGAGGVSLTNKPDPEAPKPLPESAPEKPKDDKKPTDAEIEERRKNVAVSMGWEKAEPKPVEKPKVEEPPAKPVEEKPKEEPPKKVKKPEEAPPVESDDDKRTERLISKTAKETAEAVTEAIKPKPEAKAVEKKPELNAEDQQIYRVFEYMGKSDPKAKGKAEEFAKFAQERYEYQAKWEKENKGKEFDPDAPEHEEFFGKQPDFDEDAFEQAKVDMRIEARVQEKLDAELGPQRERQAHEERTKVMQQAMPIVAEQVNKQVLKLVEAVSKGLSAHLQDDKGAINLGKANIDKLIDADPIAAEVLEPMVMDELAPMLLELEKTAIKGLNYTLDPNRNAVHARIASYVADYERDVSSGPASVRTRDDGAEFITIAGKNRLIAEAEQLDGKAREAALSRIEKQYFTVTIDELEDYITDDVSVRAQKKYARLDGASKKKYGTAGAKNGTPEKVEPPAKEPEIIEEQPKPAVRQRPPSLASGTDITAVNPGGGSGAKKFGEVMADVMFGK